MAERNACAFGHAEHGGTHIAALRQQCGAARRFARLKRLAKAGEDRIGEIGVAHAIWPGNQHSRTLRKRQQFGLFGDAIRLVGFGIARSIDQCRLDPDRVAAFKIGQGCLCRQRDNHQIDRFGNGFDVLVGGQTLHGRVLGIDRINLFETGADQQIDRHAANTGLVVRCADDCDRAGFEQLVQAHATAPCAASCALSVVAVVKV